MDLKKFSIFSSIIIGSMMILCIVFSFIVIPTPFRVSEEPNSITVYNYQKSSTGTTYTKTNSGKKTYEKLYAEFVNMTNLSVFERAASGVNIYSKATQDLNQSQPTWANAKSNNITMELSFKNKQSIILSINGNTKQIDFYGLAFVVNNYNFVNDIILYYKTTSTGSYTSSPIILGAKTNNIYKIINN